MREAIERLLNEYSIQKTKSLKGNELASYIVKSIPEVIYNTGLVSKEEYLVVGSAGKGNWATIPWICIFDRSITTTAKQGIYIIYLLSSDGSSLYISLNQGCTNIRSTHSKADTIRIMREKAEQIVSQISARGFSTSSNIDLGNNLTELEEMYIKGTIFSKEYKRGLVPSEVEVQDDLRKMVEIYREYVDLNGNEPQIGKFDSWEIINKTTAIKTCDKSFFEHYGSGVPQGIYWYFDVENLGFGEKREIQITFLNKGYIAHLERGNVNNGRIRLFWDRELGKLLTGYREKNSPKAVFKKKAADVYELEMTVEDDWWPTLDEYTTGITKERWLELLRDESIFGSGWLEVLAMFYEAREGATCSALGERYGRTAMSISGMCTQMAKRVYAATLCPLAKREKGTDTYWTILFQGCEAGGAVRGDWMWRLRDELYDALTEFDIMRYLPKDGGGDKVTLTTKEAIARIRDYIAARGFSYGGHLIENFYLSLKSKPFVILAGTSGTGKTRLVKLFAEAIGAAFQPVPVRPDWSDGSDLFGHTDLNGQFIAGPVCAAFDRAIEHPDRPVLLCLDEMNLARVEYYLSDFLSVIESRERTADGHVVTSPIAQYENGIPENLYVVGTVNMDETTFPFSKKVLDRANTIEFNYVDLMPDFSGVQADAEPIRLANSYLKTEYLVLARDCAADAAYVNEICGVLQEINRILLKANAHVGYRVRDEIVFYMLNNRRADDLISHAEAMDDQIMQKILPRVQGSSANVRDMLCQLFKLCAADHDQKNGETDSERMDKVLNDDSFVCSYRRSAEKIAMMVRRFEEDGFTSYWL